MPLEMNVPWLWVSLLAQGPQVAGADLLEAQWEGHVADGNGQTPASTDTYPSTSMWEVGVELLGRVCMHLCSVPCLACWYTVSPGLTLFIG